MVLGISLSRTAPRALFLSVVLSLSCSKQNEKSSPKEATTKAPVQAVEAVPVTPKPEAPAPTGKLPAPRAPRIYVSNEDSGDVSVIDSVDDKEIGRIAVGKRPRGLRLSADRTRLYVAVSGSPKASPGVDETKLPPPDRSADGIAEVDLTTGVLLRTLTAGSDPEAFDLSPDGGELYASNEDRGTLGVVDLAAGKPVASVPVGEEPEGVTTRPDGAVIYVTSEEDHRVDVVDRRARKVIAQIKTGLRPRAVVFTRDGNTAVVSNELSGSVTFIDARKHQAKRELKLEIAEARPMGLALSPDDKRVFVATGRGRGVVEIDVADVRVVRAMADVGTRPWGIAMTSDGAKLYTANGPANDVSVIDVASGKVTKRIGVGSAPWTALYADPPATQK